MQGDSEYHHLTLKRVIDLSLNPECHHPTLKHLIDYSHNCNLNGPPTTLKSLYLATDALLTPTAQSLVPLIQPIPDAQMHGNHLKNLISHLLTTLHAQELGHHL